MGKRFSLLRVEPGIFVADAERPGRAICQTGRTDESAEEIALSEKHATMIADYFNALEDSGNKVP